jgi:hypothetical protein
VATLKSRAERTDRASAPGVRVAIRGEHRAALSVTWSGLAASAASSQLQLTGAAISTPDVSQCQPTPLAALLTKRNRCAVIAFHTVSS